MKIAFACDHGGVELKQILIEFASGKGYECVDLGSNDKDVSTDYPVYGYKAAKSVQDGTCDLGVIICGTGVGISLAANKMKGIRAAVCSEPFTAKLSREHNNSNMLALGARVLGIELAKLLVDTFLSAPFIGTFLIGSVK